MPAESRYTAAPVGSAGHSTTVAIDVAIIPPEAVRQRLAELNARTQSPPDGFRFGPTRLPHLTIAQQLVGRAHVRALIDQLGALLERIDPIVLTTTAVSMPERTSSLGIAPNPSLSDLHTEVMNLLQPFHADGEGHDAFVVFTDGDRARPDDVAYVTGFRRRSAYASFAPHVTLGIGPVGGTVSPLTFVADHVGLYHLGHFCTCRQALAAWTLTASAP